MHVMVATDGAMKPEKTAPLVARLAGSDGKVTILTVVEIPRRLLTEMRSVFNDPAVEKERALNVEYRRTQAGDPEPTHWIGDDAVVARYKAQRTEEATGPMRRALEDLGVSPSVEVRESEDAAKSIIEAITELNADVLAIGTKGLGRFEGLLGSISTKVARLAPCSVLLVR